MDSSVYRDPIAQLLAAARSAEEAGDWESALEIYHEGLQLWEPGTPQAAELLRKVGLIHYYRGDYEVALNLFESSRRVAEQVQFPALEAQSLNCLGIVHQALGAVDLAEKLYFHAQYLSRDLQDAGLTLMVDQNLAIVACIRGQSEQALVRYLRVLAQFRAMGDAHGAARVLINIGMVYVDQERWSEAEDAYDQALTESMLDGDRETLGTLQLNRAELYLKLQRFDDARACCDQAYEIFGQLESKSGLGETYKAYGALYRESGKLHLSETHLVLVRELASDSNQPLLEAEAEVELAMTRLAQNRNREALDNLNRAHRLFTDLQTRGERIHIDRQLQRLEMCYLQVAQAWGDTVEATDLIAVGHCTRVADYSCRLAEELGASPSELVTIRAGALLHDIGRANARPDTLSRNGTEDPRDSAETRNHAVAGDEIVAELSLPWDIRPIVRSHHERWDGNGYPDQLAGERIPADARMVCIADMFDALTTARGHHRPLVVSDALDFMQACAGTILDPTFFAIFRNLIETGAIDLRNHLPAQLRMT